MFNNVYKRKKVLVTGHTGFKGTWLSTWLLKLGSKVVGVSKDVPTSPSIYESLEVKEKISDYQSDIRDLESMTKIIADERPCFTSFCILTASPSSEYFITYNIGAKVSS